MPLSGTKLTGIPLVMPLLRITDDTGIGIKSFVRSNFKREWKHDSICNYLSVVWC